MKKYLSLAKTIYQTRRNMEMQPRMLTFLVTFRCNARCIMCDSWKKERSRELTLQNIEDIFHQLPSLDIVRLSGGEPFLRKDFPAIVAATQKILKPLMLHITTNGFLTDKIIDFCKNRDTRIPLYLMFSIDGEKEKHNHIRGRAFAWDRVWETINELHRYKKFFNINLAVNQTIVDNDGHDQYMKLHSLLGSLDIVHNVVFAYEESATYHGTQEKHVLKPEDGMITSYKHLDATMIEKICTTYLAHNRKSPFFNRIAKEYYLKGIQDIVNKKQRENQHCAALHAHMRLFPDGTVPTCQFNSHDIGNMKKEPFQSVWYGEKASRQRKWVRHCPGCWAECEVLPNALYSGELLRHLFSFKKSS